MRTLTAALALAPLLLAGPAALPSPASAALETCRGVPATIVDDGGSGILMGTDGPDVIVSHGRSVSAEGGDDLVCGEGAVHGVEAGDGDDVVDLTKSDDYTQATLGDGDDTFYGGAADDTVFDGEQAAPTAGSDVDEIRTGRGDDTVESGAGPAVNHDRVFLGSGKDSVSIVPTASDGSLDLGPGSGYLHLLLVATTEETWTVDAVEQTVTHAAGVMHWRGRASSYGASIDDTMPLQSLTFLGTPGDDVLGFGLALAYPRVSARLRGGDDALVVGDRTADGSSYLLGGGDDSLVLNSNDGFGGGTPNHTVRVDLEQRRLDYGTTAPTAAVNGVESLIVSGIDVKVVGTAADETIRVNACRIVVRAGAGADLVRRGATGLGYCHDEPNRLAGGPGRDTLVGQPRTDDFLVGGRGYDVAKAGRGGVDRCLAEVTRGCELT